jgi:HTH-type transcriptional regulator/antitoxin HigA
MEIVMNLPVTHVLRDDKEYNAALDELSGLMDLDFPAGSREAERYELLRLLIADYDRRSEQLPPPDPIEAIRFRMEQEGLRQKDLVPYLGSASRVSEILSGKRPLTINNIRALHRGLGIPLESLVGDNDTNPTASDEDNEPSVDWSAFPMKEMLKRKWFEPAGGMKSDAVMNAMREFIGTYFLSATPAPMYRASSHVRSARGQNQPALMAWTARVISQAEASEAFRVEYDHGSIDAHFLRTVAQLSCLHDGPLPAVELLRSRGIAVVIERHLPGTHLDGAAVMTKSGHPVMGLTLRHNRLDNFWFTLLHELAHVLLHLRKLDGPVYDDLDADNGKVKCEIEADRMSADALIPPGICSRMTRNPPANREEVIRWAREAGVAPCIIAGRVRHETGNFKVFSDMIGNGKVRKLFREEIET